MRQPLRLPSFHHRAAAGDDDACVVTRNGRIVDGDVAVIAATDERVAGCQVELLQQEAETVPGGFGTIGAHVGSCVTLYVFFEATRNAPPNLKRTFRAFKQPITKTL